MSLFSPPPVYNSVLFLWLRYKSTALEQKYFFTGYVITREMHWENIKIFHLYVEENKHSGLNKIFTAPDTCHM